MPGGGSKEGGYCSPLGDTAISLWRVRRRETIGNLDLWGAPPFPHDAERAVMETGKPQGYGTG